MRRPKQYLPLAGRRVIDHALLALCRSELVDGVLVGIRPGDRWWRAQSQSQPFEHAKLLGISRGGAQRAHTVLNALDHLTAEHAAAADDWVLVHDAARPCLRGEDIEKLVAAARGHGGGAVLALRLMDTLKRANSEGIIEGTVGGSGGGGNYWRAVTPQMFRCAPLAAALRQSLRRGVVPTDESAAMEMSGVHAPVVAGHSGNIKITVPGDLELAAGYLEEGETARQQ